MPPRGSDRSATSPSATFLGSLALRLGSPVTRVVPGLMQIGLEGAGRLRGPGLSGRLAGGAGSIQADANGVGLLRFEGPIDLMGRPALLQASGRCDFGAEGPDLAASGTWPRASATLMVRLLTNHPGATALNRSLAFAVGEVDLANRSLDLDLFSMQSPRAADAPEGTRTGASP